MRNFATSMIDYFGVRQQPFSTRSCLQPSPNAQSLLPPSAFLNLAPELRLQIYSHVFRDSKIWVDVEPETTGDLTLELVLWWQRKRRRAKFESNERWPILLTCKACYQEARQLFVVATQFVGAPQLAVRDSNKPTYRCNTLIEFAENISEFSRLNLVEIREFLGRGYPERATSPWMHNTSSASLCIQAIPLFPSVRTCVLSHVFCDHVNRREPSYIWDQLTGSLTERDTERMLQKVKRNDMVLGRFIQLIRDDEYSYMRHIDFLLIVRLRPCAHFNRYDSECATFPTRYYFEVCVICILFANHSMVFELCL